MSAVLLSTYEHEGLFVTGATIIPVLLLGALVGDALASRKPWHRGPSDMNRMQAAVFRAFFVIVMFVGMVVSLASLVYLDDSNPRRQIVFLAIIDGVLLIALPFLLVQLGLIFHRAGGPAQRG